MSGDLIFDLIRMLLALTLVVGLMLGLAWVMRRFDILKMGQTPTPRPQGVDIQHTRAIDSRRRLVHVTWKGQDILLLLGPNNDIVVARDEVTENTNTHDD